jgi:hypothetical protein
MFTSWSSFVDTKYRLYTSGQGFAQLDGPNTDLYHFQLGTFKTPTTITYYNPNKTYLSYLKITQPKYKNLIQIDNSLAMASYDIAHDGYEKILITHNDFNPKKMTMFYYSKTKQIWKYKKFDNPSSYQNTGITIIPNGFLVGNIKDAPFLMKWNNQTSMLEYDKEFVQYDSNLVKKFNTRSIVNMKGLIKHIDGFVINGNPKKHLQKNHTFHQYFFKLYTDKLIIEPWLDFSKMNSMSVTFVNINPKKEIYGFLFGNWAQESYLYMFKKNKFIKKHTFEVSYCTTVICADFDNDGIDEILFINGYLYNTLYKVHDENNIEEINIGQAYNNSYYSPKDSFYLESTTVMDLDKDGFLEIYTGAGYAFSVGNVWYKVWRGYRKNNRYLRIFPKTKQLTPCPGAIVKIRYNDTLYKRIIDTGGSSLSQNEPIAHFGLGNYEGTVDVTVKWTDGSKTHLKNISGNQVLNCIYDKN